MTVIAKLADGRLIASASSAGPSSYDPTSGISIAVTDLKQVESVLAVTNNGGYLVDPGDCSISGNTVTIKPRYFDYDATADGAAIDVGSGTNLSGVTFTVIAIGK